MAADKLEHGGAEPKEFYQAKLATAEFFFERMLPAILRAAPPGKRRRRLRRGKSKQP